MSSQAEDSKDPWRYAILLTKFVILFLDAGLAKSFGVLMPEMTSRYDADYKTMAFICSLPATLMYFTAPIGRLLLRFVDRRTLAVFGGLLSSVPIICIPFTNNIFVLGALMATTGLGMTLVFLPSMIAINEFFPKSFIAANTLTLFGSTAGAFILPVIVERSLEGFGFAGAYLILGGMCLHAIPCAAAIRKRRDNVLTKDDNFALELESLDCSDREFSSSMHTRSTLPLEHTKGGQVSDGEVLQARMDCSSARSSSSKCECSTLLTDPTQDRIISYDKAEYEKRPHKICEARKDEQTIPQSSWLALATEKIKTFIFVSEPLYTLIIPAMFLQSYILYAWMLFLIPHGEWLGIDQSRAVFLASISGLSGVFGRILYLVLLRFDWDNLPIFSASCVVCSCSFFMDSASSAYAFQAMIAFFQGFTMFIIDALPHAMMKLSVKNNSNIDTAIAVNAFVVGAGATTGDILSGHIFDVTASYKIVYLTFGGILLLVVFNLTTYAFIDRRHKPSDERSG